jgi:hypothetical protein
MIEPHSEQSGASAATGTNGSSYCGSASVARSLVEALPNTAPWDYY